MTTNEPPGAPEEPTPTSPAPTSPAPTPAPPVPTPAVPAPTAAPTWRSNTSIVKWLSALIVLDGIAALVAIVFLVRRLGIFSDLEHRRGSGFDLIQRDTDAANNVQSIAVTILVLMVATLIVFIVWMWRSAKNNEALGRTQARFGPGWAIGGWFIPIANFVIPILMMQDLWRGADSSVPRGDARWKIADRSALIGWWWGLLLGSRIAVSAFSGNRDDRGYTISQLRTNVNLAILSSVLSIAAAVLGVLVVRALTARQEECLRVQREQWGHQTGAAAPSS